MDPSTAQHQKMSSQSLETLLVCSEQNQDQKKSKPQPEQALKCPRCESTNTKFCYYNNYSLTQPRYFCKSCRRYWTKGGTLRNVPVGGGCRKNKRSSLSSSSSSSKNKIQEDTLICPPNTNPLITGLPSLGYDSIDLSLAFARLQNNHSVLSSSHGTLGFGGDLSIFGNSCDGLGNPSVDTFKNGGFLGSQKGNFNNLCYGFMGNHNNTTNNGEMLLPYEEMKQDLSINGNNDVIRQNESNPNKVLWGLQRQMNGESGIGGGSDMDSGRESWNGWNNSSWHGLLNSPLM